MYCLNESVDNTTAIKWGEYVETCYLQQKLIAAYNTTY